MEIKPLYVGTGEVFTDKANELDTKITDFLDPIFKGLADEGYSIRDAAHVVISAALYLEARITLKRAMKEHRKAHPPIRFSEET